MYLSCSALSSLYGVCVSVSGVSVAFCEHNGTGFLDLLHYTVFGS